MPAPNRLVHFADLHVGMEDHGTLDPGTGTSSRVRDFFDQQDRVGCGPSSRLDRIDLLDGSRMPVAHRNVLV